MSFNWSAADDSSGISSHSWLWSRDPNAEPSRNDVDQFYRSETSGQVNLYDLDESDDIDGTWYVSIIAHDEAGNWSDTVRLTYVLDTKPPLPPILDLPATDNNGYLLSNTFGLSWDDAEAETAEAYRWRLDWLGSDTDLVEGRLDLSTENAIAYEDLLESFRDGVDFNVSSSREAVWSNLDNGVWAFSVASRDLAGNESLSSTTVLLTRRYIPVTYITGVTASRDTAERTNLRIVGRGFSVGGSLTHGIIDRDGEAPWDYEYSSELEQILVYSDRIADIVGIEGMEEGTYFIGVRHPVRGVVFWDRRMKLDAGGNVKFGPFGLYQYQSLWEPATRLLRITGNELLLTMLLIVGSAAIIMTILRLLSIFRETKKLEKSARAIIAREPLSIEARKQAVVVLRSKGMKLQGKFILWFTLMVMFTILIISVALGIVWIQMERDSLAQGLESESRLMVETLASTAITSISEADKGALLLLPERKNALPDAMWTTITGPRSEISDFGKLRATPEGSEYIWATNDPDILDKLQLPRNLIPQEFDTIEAAAEEGSQILIRSTYTLQPDGNYQLDNELAPSDRELLVSVFRQISLWPNEIEPGIRKIEDELSPAIEILRNQVESEIQEAGVSRMITDLLDLSRIESGRLQLNVEPFDIRREIEDLLSSITPILEKEKMKGLLTVRTEGTIVRGDRTRIWQGLNNIISNAIRYSPEGGTIEIRLDDIPTDETNGQRMLLVSVRDEGPGISEEGAEKLFEPFFYRSSGLTGAHGAGLGLAIVKQLVELHGGIVSIRNAEAGGTVFSFTLPG